MEPDKFKDKFFVEAKGGANNREQARIKCKDQTQRATLSYDGKKYMGFISDLNNDCFACVINNTDVEKIESFTELEFEIMFLNVRYEISGQLIAPPVYPVKKQGPW